MLSKKKTNPLKLKKMQKLLKVDYNSTSHFTFEHSFTILDWLILEKIRGKKLFALRDIDVEQQLHLCFNIFPGGKTALHKLAEVAIEDG